MVSWDREIELYSSNRNLHWFVSPNQIELFCKNEKAYVYIPERCATKTETKKYLSVKASANIKEDEDNVILFSRDDTLQDRRIVFPNGKTLYDGQTLAPFIYISNNIRCFIVTMSSVQGDDSGNNACDAYEAALDYTDGEIYREVRGDSLNNQYQDVTYQIDIPENFLTFLDNKIVITYKTSETSINTGIVFFVFDSGGNRIYTSEKQTAIRKTNFIIDFQVGAFAPQTTFLVIARCYVDAGHTPTSCFVGKCKIHFG